MSERTTPFPITPRRLWMRLCGFVSIALLAAWLVVILKIQLHSEFVLLAVCSIPALFWLAIEIALEKSFFSLVLEILGELRPLTAEWRPASASLLSPMLLILAIVVGVFGISGIYVRAVPGWLIEILSVILGLCVSLYALVFARKLWLTDLERSKSYASYALRSERFEPLSLRPRDPLVTQLLFRREIVRSLVERPWLQVEEDLPHDAAFVLREFVQKLFRNPFEVAILEKSFQNESDSKMFATFTVDYVIYWRLYRIENSGKIDSYRIQLSMTVDVLGIRTIDEALAGLFKSH